MQKDNSVTEINLKVIIPAGETPLKASALSYLGIAIMLLSKLDSTEDVMDTISMAIDYAYNIKQNP